jgi:predicted permease
MSLFPLADTLRAASREHLDILCQDTRFAVRVLRRSPGFALTAIATLALGIGANTAVFSLVRAVLLRPLPYHEPDRLVSVARSRPHLGAQTPVRGILTGDDVLSIRAKATTVRDVALVHIWGPEISSPIDVLGPDGAERLRGGLVTSNFFETIGVTAARGRLFGPRDSDREPLAVISDGYWRRKFGGDPNVVGRHVDGVLVGRHEQAPRRFTVIGVLPARFRFTYPRETEFWAMLPWDGVQADASLQYEVVARLEPGVTAGQAAAELTALGRRPDREPTNVSLVTPLPELASADARPGVLLLAAVAAVVLLIACVNVILLLLARVAERTTEVAVRAALGAGWARIGRQLLVEAGMLVGAGGVVGVATAFALQPVLRALVPSALTRGDEVSVDIPVLAFAAGLCALLTLLCGLAPLWHVSTRAVQDRLKQGGWQASASRGVSRWRRDILMTQVALVLVLLVSATLLLHSLWRLRHVNLGYDGSDVLTMEMYSLLPTTWTPGWLPGFQRDLLDRVRSLPGVTEASLTSSVPMRGGTGRFLVGRAGGPVTPVVMGAIDTGYFDVMRIPILVGRTFSAGDTAESPRVAIVSRSFASLLFGDGNPLGEHLESASRRRFEIVGVVGDVREDVREPAIPTFYVPRTQQMDSKMCLVVRTRSDLATTAAAIRTVVQALAPAQPVEGITTFGDLVTETIAADRFYAVTAGAFGGIALLLAVAGLIGVVRRGVAERTRELAIRTALGADARKLVHWTVAQELRPVLAGALLGLADLRHFQKSTTGGTATYG